MSTRVRRGDDSGAALVIAMIFVTLVGMVSAVLLSFADTGVDTTIQLRKQSSAAYTADGAAQVAINALRDGSYSNATGQSCFGSSNGLPLPNFPTAASGSAFVSCAPDPASGSASSGPLNGLNTPGNAILSLGGVSGTESGVQVTATAASNSLQVKGGVFSDSAITVTPGTLQSDTSITAQSCNPAASAMTSPKTDCSSRTPQVDPTYATSTGLLTAQSVPTCPSGGGLVTFTPGVYTSSQSLSSCANDTMWFKPGVYYFNFAVNKPTWTMGSGALVGGTTTTTLTAVAPAMPGSCVSPLTSTTPSAGVQFVFLGTSTWDVRGTAKVELCGSYSATAPPIAIYGSRFAVGNMAGESGCVTTVGGCPLVSSSDGALSSAMYVQGTVYAPLALVALSYGQNGSLSTGQFIKDGVIARSVSASLYGVSPAGVQLALQTLGPKGAETDVFLQVYVCPGQASCTASTGRLQLESKVGVSTTAGAVVPGVRTVRVYSWAVQR